MTKILELPKLTKINYLLVKHNHIKKIYILKTY